MRTKTKWNRHNTTRTPRRHPDQPWHEFGSQPVVDPAVKAPDVSFNLLEMAGIAVRSKSQWRNGESHKLWGSKDDKRLAWVHAGSNGNQGFMYLSVKNGKTFTVQCGHLSPKTWWVFKLDEVTYAAWAKRARGG